MLREAAATPVSWLLSWHEAANLTVVIRKVSVNGKPLEVSLGLNGVSVIETEAGVYSVLKDGHSYEVRSENGTIWIQGHPFDVEVEDPRAPQKRLGSATAGGQQTVRAAMPGKVVRVLVSAGDEVAAGQGIVVVEAMKMQNEIKSPVAGTVLSVAVRDGAAVARGDTIAVIE